MSIIKGYKVFYNKDKGLFEYENFLSPLISVAEDSPVWWMFTLKNAQECTRLHNKRLDEIKICKDCANPFLLSKQEEEWYEDKGLSAPKRCFECRVKRRQQKNNG